MWHVKANPDSATTQKETAVVIDVLANDEFANDNPSDSTEPEILVDIRTQPANGSVEVLPDNNIRYTPNPGFTGTDTFDYEVVILVCEDPVTEISGWMSGDTFEYSLGYTVFPEIPDPEEGDIVRAEFSYDGEDYFFEMVYQDGYWIIGLYDLPDEDFFASYRQTFAVFTFGNQTFRNCFASHGGV